ncbi:PREDICTED: uncharacterized protein LOC106329511 [Brassica oleracea var. oleracea]|uniref:Uncharacterized protein n=1 Tax=Brassica oleracea var. oleracea TaxID=109376 RepID=A0A0D3B5D1_BRAOL|nr:PREDICTED: uncharacterized protein LOC106329511 [Brassica oleracea var. oleracea]XP_013623644.1 PREDICTED: uncharacterized protein LOC106329511 [Brassica oleracea var. oleracea]XP_013623645.1 PREDICTED: uncharacterized protein LOC106329511 [Brassica oleracea var. oleracea]XP_013623646.1 PREDICTED: uncharacterized protein LOC106329511 [Brassica oleracea var. oleracea]XP_013623647.1 PREDICTED: uncharacterized protein LOC106329511 [Brassica oleracea var. oleracea]XP_013623648.1 PREDICTED: unch
MDASSSYLKPCSTRETKKAMEVVVNSKRKAEFEPEEEEEEEEDEWEESDGEISESEMLQAPEWDVDSFDGVEYYSSPDVQLSTLSDEEEAIEDYNIIKRQLIDSKGFYADPNRKHIYHYKGICPVGLDRVALPDRTFRDYWEEMVHVCLERHNLDKDPKVEFVEVVRGHYRGGPRSKSYITFMAREKPDGPLVEYQAKAMVTLDRKRHPILCRPTPPTPNPP